MTNTNGRLGFKALAESAFAFLRDRFGFRIESSEDTRLVFQGNGVFVAVFHGRSSFELGIEIGRTNVPGERFNWTEVLEVVAPEAAETARFQTSDTVGLARGLQHFSGLLALHGAHLLRNEPGSFDSLREPIRRARQAYTDRRKFGAIKNRAQRAWQEKAWDEACTLYRSIRGELTEIESKRLEFLEKRLSTQNSDDDS